MDPISNKRMQSKTFKQIKAMTPGAAKNRIAQLNKYCTDAGECWTCAHRLDMPCSVKTEIETIEEYQKRGY